MRLFHRGVALSHGFDLYYKNAFGMAFIEGYPHIRVAFMRGSIVHSN